jgi:hypothetical protein
MDGQTFRTLLENGGAEMFVNGRAGFAMPTLSHP